MLHRLTVEIASAQSFDVPFPHASDPLPVVHFAELLALPAIVPLTRTILILINEDLHASYILSCYYTPLRHRYTQPL